MTLWEMLDCTLYYGDVVIYARNNYDQCVFLFDGCVADARRDTDNVWDYLPYEIDQWMVRNSRTLIYVKHYAYNDRLETCYSNSDTWTQDRRPFKWTREVEMAEGFL